MQQNVRDKKMKVKINNYWMQKNPVVFTLFNFYAYKDLYSFTILNFSFTFYTKSAEWILHI